MGILLMMVSCNGTLKTISSYDQTIDFEQFKTYSYLPVNHDSIIGFNVKVFADYAVKYMNLLGYEKSIESNKSDLTIYIHTHTNMQSDSRVINLFTMDMVGCMGITHGIITHLFIYII